jgi:DNA-binding NtrC family response regulator
MARAARQLGKTLEDLSPAFLTQAEAYDWPGNVRELENLVMRAAIRSPGPLLETAGPLGVQADRDPERPSEPVRSPQTLTSVERAHILAMLELTGWVIEGERGAAAVLGLNPSTLRGRMRKLGVQKPA